MAERKIKTKAVCDSAAWGGTKIALAVLTCLLLITATAFANVEKKSKDLDLDSKGSKAVDVIVQYADDATDQHDKTAKGHGAVIKQHFGVIKGAAMHIPADKLAKLIAHDPSIKFVTPDRPVKGATARTDGFTAVNAGVAQSYGYTGAGVTVAVLDSGIGSHDDLYGRVRASFDFTGEGTDDLYGHGTHVAGIIAGNGYRSSCWFCAVTFMGIAPRASLVSFKVLDHTGAGSDSNVIAAIDAAIALKDTYGIRVLNLSVGRPVFESYTLDPLTQAVEKAWKAGIFVVVSAGNLGRMNSQGNNGYGTITSPGNDPYVITVGAMRTMNTPTRTDDTIATYSSKGPSLLDHVVKPDIVAPGNQIVSLRAPNGYLGTLPQDAVPVNTFAYTIATSPSAYYTKLSGTSMAAPMVSGAAALLLQQNPSLTPDQIKARLMKTAFKSLVPSTTVFDSTTGQTYFEQADIFTVGAGYLDIYAALTNSDLAPTTTGVAQSPTAMFDTTTGTAHLVTGTYVLWGNSVLWGDSVVWGNSVLWGDSILWGDSVVWGDSTSQAFSILWGDSVLWGDSILWGDSTSCDGSSILWGDSVLWGDGFTDPEPAGGTTTCDPTTGCTTSSGTGL